MGEREREKEGKRETERDREKQRETIPEAPAPHLLQFGEKHPTITSEPKRPTTHTHTERE